MDYGKESLNDKRPLIEESKAFLFEVKWLENKPGNLSENALLPKPFVISLKECSQYQLYGCASFKEMPRF